MTRFQGRSHLTMIAPPPGFAGRVMARIQAQEESRARRRAAAGFWVLVAAAAALLVTTASLLVGLFLFFFSNLGSVLSALEALEPLALALQAMLQATTVAVSAVLENTGDWVMTGYAIGALSITLVWIRVVCGSLQPSLASTLREV